MNPCPFTSTILLIIHWCQKGAWQQAETEPNSDKSNVQIGPFLSNQEDFTSPNQNPIANLDQQLLFSLDLHLDSCINCQNNIDNLQKQIWKKLIDKSTTEKMDKRNNQTIPLSENQKGIESSFSENSVSNLQTIPQMIFNPTTQASMEEHSMISSSSSPLEKNNSANFEQDHREENSERSVSTTRDRSAFWKGVSLSARSELQESELQESELQGTLEQKYLNTGSELIVLPSASNEQKEILSDQSLSDAMKTQKQIDSAIPENETDLNRTQSLPFVENEKVENEKVENEKQDNQSFSNQRRKSVAQKWAIPANTSDSRTFIGTSNIAAQTEQIPEQGNPDTGEQTLVQEQFPNSKSLFPILAPAAKPQNPAKNPNSHWANKFIGPYRLIEELGRGGMGVVYLGYQDKLKRKVALKILPDSADKDSIGLKRFEAEAVVVASLNHPNIIQIFEVGQAEGLSYLAMEFANYGTLSEYLHGNPLPAPEAAKLMEILARAMQHAHSRGIIHRDLKPSNILLALTDGSRDGVKAIEASTISLSTIREQNDLDKNLLKVKNSAQGKFESAASPLYLDKISLVPKIADFGLAKLLNATDHLTRTGVAMGTPSYMSPEQAKGDIAHLGIATDIYSLGAILYELITGRPPFLAANLMAIIRQVVDQEPVPPSQLQPAVPRDLETICLKCLKKDIKSRYDSVADLAEDLARFLNQKPILARPASIQERAWKWARRQPVIASLSAALVFAIIFSLVAISLLWLRAEQQRSIAVAEKIHLQNAEAETSNQKRQLEIVQCGLLLDRGIQSCQAGDVKNGLNWLLKSLELAISSSQVALEKTIRSNLATWMERLPQTILETQTGSDIRVLKFSPDGNYLAVGLVSGSVLLYRTSDYHLVKSFRLPNRNLIVPNNIRDLAWSLDSKRLATASIDGKIHLWNMTTFQEEGRNLEDPRFQDLWRVEFSNDQKYLYSLPDHGEWVSWSLEQRKPQNHKPFSARHGFFSMALSRKNQLIALGGIDGRVQLFDAASLLTRKSTPDLGNLIHALEFSPRGNHLLISVAPRLLRNWNVDNNIFNDVNHESTVTALAFQPDGLSYVTGTSSGVLQSWDDEENISLGQLEKEIDCITSIHFHPDGKKLAVANQSGFVRILQMPIAQQKGGQIYFQNPSPESSLLDFELSKTGGKLLLVTSLGSELRDGGSGSFIQKYFLNSVITKSTAAALSPDGLSLFRSGFDGYFDAIFLNAAGVRIEDAHFRNTLIPPARLIAYNPLNPDKVYHYGVVPSNLHFNIATNWEIDLRQRQRQRNLFSNLKEQVLHWDISPDGCSFILACTNGKIVHWDIQKDQMIGQPITIPNAVTSIVMAPSGKEFAVGTRDGILQQFSLATHQPVHEAIHHESEVTSIAYSPDENILASGTILGKMVFWDPATGRAIGPHLQDRSPIVRVRFHPKQPLLLIGYKDHRIRQWCIPRSPTTQSIVEIQNQIDSRLKPIVISP